MDIIIGAGATGLGYGLFSPNDYQIIEADSEIGGYCKTIKQDGFVWDYSGHFFHFREPEMEKFICKCIDSETLLRCRKHTQIKYKDRYIDFPFQKNIHQLSKPELIECLYDLFCNEYETYQNFQEMLYCKFGKGIAEKFLIPYNEKLYACNLNKLDTDAMGRFFPYADIKDIIANFKNSDSKSYNDYFTYPRGGAIEYIQSLRHRIPDNKIKLSEKVIAVDTHQKIVKTTKGEIGYDNLISTIPFPQLLQLCNIPYDPTIYSWNKVLVFNLGFDSKGTDIRNNWIYFPDKGISFYRIGYYDNIFQTDRMSLYVELGFDKDADIDVEKWYETVIEDLKSSGIINSQSVISRHHVIMDPAYVHITKDSIENVKVLKQQLKKHHIYSIGRYGSWTYCSIEDGLIEARSLSQSINK